MMQRLANDVSFWLALGAIFGLIKVWATSKAADISARSSKDTVTVVATGQSVQQATMQQLVGQVAQLVVSVQAALSQGQQPQATPPMQSPVPPSVPFSGGVQPGILNSTVAGAATEAPAIVLPQSD
jgi:hypothetical protein